MFILDFVKKNIAILIPIALIAGLIKGHWFPMEYSRIICISALLVMIFPVFINLEFDKGLKEFTGSKKTILLASIFNFIVYPLIALTLGYIFLKEYPAMWLGLVLLSLIPTSGMTINWTYFTKGKVSAVMSIVSASIIFSFFYLPFVIPYISQTLMNTGDLDINRIVILEKLFFIIVIPVIFGWIVRTLILKYKGRDTFNSIKPINANISSLGVLIVSFLVMSLNSTQGILTNPKIMLLAVIPVALFYLFIFAISHYVGYLLLPVDEAKAFFYGTAARYHVIILGIVLGTFQQYDFLGLITIIIAIGLAIQIPALAFYSQHIMKKERLAKDKVIAIDEKIIINEAKIKSNRKA